MKEIDVLGLFFPPFLIWGVIAFLILGWVRVLLARLGFYRFVWHRSLVDIALWVIVSGVVVTLLG
ncbi:MAG: DUF1656 domain-containing protein [Leptospirillum sp.]|jgi:hypothetical protein